MRFISSSKDTKQHNILYDKPTSNCPAEIILENIVSNWDPMKSPQRERFSTNTFTPFSFTT